MTRAELKTLRFMARPIKPLALALTIATFVLFVGYDLTNADSLGGSPAGDFVGLVGLASALVLTVGWWRRSQTLAELGLLLASGVWITRAATLALEGFPDPIAFFLSSAWAIAAAGAYLLEAQDGNGGLCAALRRWKWTR